MYIAKKGLDSTLRVLMEENSAWFLVVRCFDHCLELVVKNTSINYPNILYRSCKSSKDLFLGKNHSKTNTCKWNMLSRLQSLSYVGCSQTVSVKYWFSTEKVDRTSRFCKEFDTYKLSSQYGILSTILFLIFWKFHKDLTNAPFTTIKSELDA